MKNILVKTESAYHLVVNDKIIGSLGDSDGKLQKLSKENCDEIFGVIDIQQQINKKLNDYHVFREAVAYYNKDKYAGKKVEDAFIKGAEYIVKIILSEQSKLFTVEDMKKAYLNSHKYEWFDDLIKSLQQPTEIEVEVKTISVGHCNCPCHRYNNMTHFSPCCYPKQVYKLDENGCLILKKK